MPIDATTIILTAICTGIGVSIGNSFFDIFLKDYFKKLRRQSKRLAALKNRVLHYKRPWLAAFLNFFVWGSGYLYVGKRKFAGIVLLIVEFFIIGSFSFNLGQLKTIFESLSYSFLSIALGLLLSYDAYRLAIEKNKERSGHR